MTATTVFQKQYVEWREKGYWLKEGRVSLDSIVYAFLNGTSPEGIIQSFPILTLEQVYGAISWVQLALRDRILPSKSRTSQPLFKTRRSRI